MLIVPLIATPAQVVSVTLSGQPCDISVYTKSTGMFIDLYVASTLLIGGVVAQNMNRVVRDAYFGFVGDLAFFDTQGSDDPLYTGLGSRWVLLYFAPGDALGTPAPVVAQEDAPLASSAQVVTTASQLSADAKTMLYGLHGFNVNWTE